MDQRRWIRFPVHFHSSFKSANVVDGEGNIVDLSFRGCRVYSLTEVRPGTTLEVRIYVSDTEPPITIEQAVVRWYRAKHFGLEFVTLPPDEWARLQHVVKQIEMQPYQRGSADR